MNRETSPVLSRTSVQSWAVLQFTWDPGTNDAVNATLFIRGTENFDPGSVLIIKRWYNYSIPLGGNGELQPATWTINTPGPTAGTIAEWNQSNWFQTRRVLAP